MDVTEYRILDMQQVSQWQYCAAFIAKDRRNLKHGTMSRSSFFIRPTKNRSDLSKNSTMDRI
jgi:hypothetical protein